MPMELRGAINVSADERDVLLNAAGILRRIDNDPRYKGDVMFDIGNWYATFTDAAEVLEILAG